MKLRPFKEMSAWMQVSCRQTELFQKEVIDPIFEHMDKDKATAVIGNIWRCENLGNYKQNTSEEQMQKDLVYEENFIDKCNLITTNEQIEAGGPQNTELCPHTDCPKYGPDCWGTYSLTQPETIDLGDFNAEYTTDPTFRGYLRNQKKPTPTFKDKEYEKQFYLDLEQEYRDKGLYP